MKKKSAIFLSLLIGACTLFYTSLHAGNIATQTITMSINAINELAISGAAPTLTIGAATAGSLPNPVSSSGITWAYTTNNTATSGKTINGLISSAMPTNLQLAANLVAPTGGTSAGAVALTATAQNLVTTIPVPGNTSALNLTYTFQQTGAVATTSAFTRTVTLTMVDS